MGRMSRLVVGMMALLGWVTIVMAGDIPKQLPLQGKLTDAAGKPLEGSVGVTFRLYDEATAGTKLWEEGQTLNVSSGFFSTVLGTTNPFALRFDRPYWVDIEINGELLAPRQPLATVAYAFKTQEQGIALLSEDETMTVAGPGETTLTTSSPMTLNVGDYVVPQTTSAQARVITIGGTNATTFSVGVPYTQAIEEEPFTIFPSLLHLRTDTGETSLLVQGSTGHVGIGTTAPTSKLEVRGKARVGKLGGVGVGDSVGLEVRQGAEPLSPGSSNSHGIGIWSDLLIETPVNIGSAAVLGETFTSGTGGHNTGAFPVIGGVAATASHRGSTPVGKLMGLYAEADGSNNSLVDNAYGVYVDYVYPTGGATFTNTYGVYVGPVTTVPSNSGPGTQTHTPYSFYASDPASYNYFAGNVGIGTASPSQKLEVAGSLKLTGAGTGLLFDDGSSLTSASLGSAGALSSPTDALIQADADGDASGAILLRTGATDQMVVTNAGNVGIGTASPNTKLDVDAPGGTVPLALTQRADLVGTPKFIRFSAGTTPSRIGALGTSLGGELYLAGYNGISLVLADAANSSGLYINTAGNVGIGTTSPVAKFDVFDSNINGTGSVGQLTMMDSDAAGADGAYARQAFAIETETEGTTYGVGAIGGYAEDATAGTVDGGLQFWTVENGGSFLEKMRLTPSGNVGIGTTAPANKLEVRGKVRVGNLGNANPSEDEGIGLQVRQGVGPTAPGSSFSHSIGIWSDIVIETPVNIGSAGLLGEAITSGTGGNNAGNSSSQLLAGVAALASHGGSTPQGKLMGLYASADGTNSSLVDNAYGVYVDYVYPRGGATFTNTYGVYVGPVTTLPSNPGTQTNTPYSFYASDPASYNYFAGNVGIGTDQPGADMLDVRGSAYSSGGWNSTDADYAEWFEKEEDVKPGDIVGLNMDTGKVRRYRPGDEFLGIGSAKPAVTGNRLRETDEEMLRDHALVGLLGQLDFDRSLVKLAGRRIATPDGKAIGVLLSNGKALIGTRAPQGALTGLAPAPAGRATPGPRRPPRREEPSGGFGNPFSR